MRWALIPYMHEPSPLLTMGVVTEFGAPTDFFAGEDGLLFAVLRVVAVEDFVLGQLGQLLPAVQSLLCRLVNLQIAVALVHPDAPGVFFGRLNHAGKPQRPVVYDANDE